MVGVVTILGTSLGGDIRTIRGMIGIGIYATAEVGMQTYGGAGEVTTTHGVLIMDHIGTGIDRTMDTTIDRITDLTTATTTATIAIMVLEAIITIA